MCPHTTPSNPAEGSQREQLAAYFLAAPPRAEQTPSQRREYLQKLHHLGQLERQEIRRSAGAARPLVWGNPAPLMQALLSAAQRLAAGLGQPLLLFPARETAIGADTLLHPRLLSVALCDLLCRACAAAPRSPVWVRLQEQKGGLAVAVTATLPFADKEGLSLIQECTKLHGGSLVHCDETIVFSCGQAEEPPAGVRLYCCPTEEDLLTDTLSPVWSIFYAGFYSALSSSPSGSSISSTSGKSSEDSSSPSDSSMNAMSSSASEGSSQAAPSSASSTDSSSTGAE